VRCACTCRVRAPPSRHRFARASHASFAFPDSLPLPTAAATLILPHDATWTKAARADDASIAATAAASLAAARAAGDATALSSPAGASFLAACAAALRATPRGKAALLLGGGALLTTGGALSAAAAIGAALGAPLLCANNFARADRGAGVPPLTRLPYFPKDAAKALSSYDTLVLIDAQLPVAMFGYEGGPSSVCALSEDAIWELDARDAPVALRALAAALGVTAAPSSADASDDIFASATVIQPPRPPPPGPRAAALTASLLCATVAALQPMGTILVDESLTSGTDYYATSASAPPFSHLTLTGGAIGFGPPAALGAAVACPRRRVINLQADGSALYAPQALWSQARQGCDVITIICANSRYAILKLELALQRVGVSGGKAEAASVADAPASRSLTDLSSPRVDWVALATGMGVRGVRAATAGELADALAQALATRGPTLIEAVLA
jgi:acetolactate synthase-1/2/3 large subunit